MYLKVNLIYNVNMGASTSYLKYIDIDLNIPNVTIKETATFTCPDNHLNCRKSRCWW